MRELLGKQTDHELLQEGVSAESLVVRMSSKAGHPRCTAMFFCFYPPRDACLQQGGAGGVNTTTPRFGRSVMFTPLPPGTDTARPADLSGQLQSR
jgi:hypothetical protein